MSNIISNYLTEVEVTLNILTASFSRPSLRAHMASRRLYKLTASVIITAVPGGLQFKLNKKCHCEAEEPPFCGWLQLYQLDHHFLII